MPDIRIVMLSTIERLGTMSPSRHFALLDQEVELDRIYALLERSDPSYRRPLTWRIGPRTYGYMNFDGSQGPL